MQVSHKELQLQISLRKILESVKGRKRTGTRRSERGCWATTCATVQLRISLRARPTHTPKPVHHRRTLATFPTLI